MILFDCPFHQALLILNHGLHVPELSGNSRFSKNIGLPKRGCHEKVAHHFSASCHLTPLEVGGPLMQALEADISRRLTPCRQKRAKRMVFVSRPKSRRPQWRPTQGTLSPREFAAGWAGAAPKACRPRPPMPRGPRGPSERSDSNGSRAPSAEARGHESPLADS